MEYIAPAVALIIGVLGVFYSKAGERQKLGRMAYILLGLMLAAGTVSLYGVHLAKQNEKQAEIDAADAAEQLRREKKTADTMRGVLLARMFAETDTPADGILYFDLTQPYDSTADGGPSGPSAPLAPLLGPGVRKSRITFEIEGIVDVDYRLTPSLTGAVVDASYYEYEPKVCRLLFDASRYSLEPVDGSPCKRESGYLYNATLESIAPYRSLIINLPDNQPFWKTFSRMEQAQRGSPLGNITITPDSPASARRVLAEVKHMAASVKFFRPYGEECSTTLLVHLDLAPEIKSGAVSIGINGIKDYELNFCEIIPI